TTSTLLPYAVFWQALVRRAPLSVVAFYRAYSARGPLWFSLVAAVSACSSLARRCPGYSRRQGRHPGPGPGLSAQAFAFRYRSRHWRPCATSTSPPLPACTLHGRGAPAYPSSPLISCSALAILPT